MIGDIPRRIKLMSKKKKREKNLSHFIFRLKQYSCHLASTVKALTSLIIIMISSKPPSDQMIRPGSQTVK